MECNIWLTVDTDDPDFETIAKLQGEMENIGLNYRDKVGIGFTHIQWCNFIKNLSRFESRMANMWPRMVMGFPVRLIEPIRTE